MMKKIIVMTFIILLLSMNYTADEGYAETRSGDLGTKPMVLYVHNASEAQYVFDYSTTHMMNTTLGDRMDSVTDTQRVTMNWYLAPVLAGPLPVNGNITFTIYANTTGISANANLNLKIYEVTYKSGTDTQESLIAEGGPQSYTMTSTIDAYSVSAQVNHTFQEGSSIRIYLEIQGGASSVFTAWYGDATYDSRVAFDSLNFLKVADTYTLDGSDTPKNAFDPQSPDKTIEIRANLTDPFGGYDILWVRVTVLSPEGTEVLSNVTMEKIEGTPISYNNIYEKEISYAGLSVGTYTIIVYAMDNNGHNYYYHMQKYEYGPYGDEGRGEFSIGLPNTVEFTIYDAAGQPLPYADIRMLYEGEITSSGMTDENGKSSLGVYTGTYTIQVIWMETTITGDSTIMVINGDENNSISGDELSVDSDMSVGLYGNVGNLTFHTTDADELDLDNAAVYIIYPNGSARISPLKTDADGLAYVGHVAGGEYTISVVWKGAEVFSSHVSVLFTRDDPSTIYEISTAVYNMEIYLYDSRGNTVPMVTVFVADSETGNTEAFGMSSSEGLVRVRVPGGDKRIQGYWNDVIVYDGGHEISSSGKVDLTCNIYYLEISVLDADGVSISGAHITLEKNGTVLKYSRTDSEGDATFRVAPGEYTIRTRFTTTYMMKAIDLEKTEDVSVVSDTEQTVKFESYPPNAVTTPLVMFSLIVLLLLVITGFLAYKLIKSPKGESDRSADVSDAGKPDNLTSSEETEERTDIEDSSESM